MIYLKLIIIIICAIACLYSIYFFLKEDKLKTAPSRNFYIKNFLTIKLISFIEYYLNNNPNSVFTFIIDNNDYKYGFYSTLNIYISLLQYNEMKNYFSKNETEIFDHETVSYFDIVSIKKKDPKDNFKIASLYLEGEFLKTEISSLKDDKIVNFAEYYFNYTVFKQLIDIKKISVFIDQLTPHKD